MCYCLRLLIDVCRRCLVFVGVCVCSCFVLRSLLLRASCSLLDVPSCCLLFVVLGLSFVVCCLMLAIWCCVWFVACLLVCVVYRLMCVACC